jgi:hypothetical protein
MAYKKHENKRRQKMKENQAREKIINIAERICENVAKIRYGSVSAILKIHNGRVIDVTHSTTESTREQEKQNET